MRHFVWPTRGSNEGTDANRGIRKWEGDRDGLGIEPVANILWSSAVDEKVGCVTPALPRQRPPQDFSSVAAQM